MGFAGVLRPAGTFGRIEDPVGIDRSVEAIEKSGTSGFGSRYGIGSGPLAVSGDPSAERAFSRIERRNHETDPQGSTSIAAN